MNQAEKRKRHRQNKRLRKAFGPNWLIYLAKLHTKRFNILLLAIDKRNPARNLDLSF